MEKNGKLTLSLLIAIICSVVTKRGSCYAQKGALIDRVIKVGVFYSGALQGDSLTLYLNDAFVYDSNGKSFHGKEKKNNFWYFDIPVHSTCGYFSIRSKLNKIAEQDIILNNFWEATDSITITIYNEEKTYSGRGAGKYQVKEEMEKIFFTSATTEKEFDGNILGSNPFSLDTVQKTRLLHLDKSRSKLSELAFGVLKADLLTQFLSSCITRTERYFQENVNGSNNGQVDKFIGKFNEVFFPVHTFGIDQKFLAHSKDYLNYLNKLYMYAGRLNPKTSGPGWVHRLIIKQSPGPDIRQASLLLFFLTVGMNSEIDALFSDSQHYFHTTENLAKFRLLRGRFIAPLTGYNFIDVNGKLVKISDFTGKVILIDLWFRGCGGCALYYKNVLSKLERDTISIKDLVILSISVDKNLVTWRKGMQDGIYTSNSVVNLNTGVIGFEHPFLKQFDILWFPTPILVGRDGRIVNFKTQDLWTYEGLSKEILKL